jgi:protein involved in polysaccharide export with SLBB domain
MRDGRHIRWCRNLASWSAVLTLLLTSGLAAQAPSQPTAQQPPSPTSTAAPSTTQPLQPAGALPESESEWTVWTSGRYRITPGDVIELRFPFVPELDQTLSVQPDGYVTLREVGDIRAQGRTLPQFRAEVNEAYMPFVRDPVFTAVLKEFEKPYFVAAGEVSKPGRYELRGATTLTQAIAYAGGPTNFGKLTDVVIFRPFTDDAVSVKQVNVKDMFSKKDLSEDPLLRPGDTVYIAKTKMGKIDPILSKFSLGFYLNPFELID